ncbi:hypothetical protein [Microbacterium lacticum]
MPAARHERLPVDASTHALAFDERHRPAHHRDQDGADRAGNAGPTDSRRRTPAGVHLDADQHRTLGLALAPVVAALL